MTDEKKKRARRSREEIAAEKKAWLLRHEWAGPQEALLTVRQCAAALEEAHAACANRQPSADGFALAIKHLTALAEQIAQKIPAELR